MEDRRCKLGLQGRWNSRRRAQRGRSPTTPGHESCGDRARACAHVVEIGDPGRDHQRARHHPRDRFARLVGCLPQAIAARLLIALERPVEHRDPIEPRREAKAKKGGGGPSSATNEMVPR